MRIKISIFTAVLLAWSAIHADYYAGIDLGLTNLTVRTALTYPLESATPKQANFTEGGYGPGIKLIGGYTLELAPDQWFLSTELNYDYVNLGTQYSVQNWFLNNAITTNNQLHQMVGIFALPMYQLSKNTAVYLGPGAVYGNFSTHYNNSAGNIGVSNNANCWLNGWAIKTGLITQLRGAWQLELSYQYTRLASISATATEPISGESVSGTYHPTVSTALVGVRYYFTEKPSHSRVQPDPGQLPLPFD